MFCIHRLERGGSDMLPDIRLWNKGELHKFKRYQDRLGGKRSYNITRDGVGWRINPVENIFGQTGYLLITNISLPSGGKFGSWVIFPDGSDHSLPVGDYINYGKGMYRTPTAACAVARRMHKKYAAAVKRHAEGVKR